MRLHRWIAVSVTCALLAVARAPDIASCQSVLERPPNLSGGWLGPSGTLQFNFVHRFGVGDAPTRKVTNSPTFLLSYKLAAPLLLGFNYATSSDVAAAFPNEWELFARYGRGVVALQGGYNQAAESFDGELTAARTFGRARLMAVGRVLTNGYNSDTTRYALGGGAVLRLNRWFALAGDVASLLDKRAGEEIAWGAGLQIEIPYTPHSLSLQVTNTNTGTLQGVSRGLDRVRGGFEFTIPFTLSRYFGGKKAAAGAAAAGAAAADTAAARGGEGAAVEMKGVAFLPNRIEVAAGTTITWTNADPLIHTVTADDGSFDSGNIDPTKTFSRTFTQPGEYAVHCTPHPFMKAVIVVRQP
ncbi:MAG TPA: cupredoxin family copper-binding protein [Gemmatimonadales bacterium]|nr:cupredoxin family copper-binding protein [Gemmatimonadales bacterium]